MRIEFHVAPTRSDLDRLLTQQAWRIFQEEEQARCVLWLQDEAELQYFDQLLWTQETLSFMPHAPLHDAAAANCRFHLLHQPELPPPCDILWHYSAATSLHPPARCRLLLDWVCNEDSLQLQASRQRYRHYAQLGLEVQTFKY